MNIVVGIADMKISENPQDIITTYSLGSCIAVVVYDPTAKVGGMIHVMLPDSKIERNADVLNPFKYVNTGIPKLYKKLFAIGAKRKHLVTKIAGGASVMDTNNVFNIGKRNYAAVRKMLWRNNVMIKNEDIGGSKSRTVQLHLQSGKVLVKNSHEEYEL